MNALPVWLPWLLTAIAVVLAAVAIARLPGVRARAEADARRARDSEVADAQRSGAASAARAEALAARLDAAERELAERRAESAAQAATLARCDEAQVLAERRLAELGAIDAERARLGRALAAAETELATLRAELHAARQQAEERKRLLDDAASQLRGEFQALAAQLLDERSRAFAEQSQAQLGTLLSPLREQLDAFRRTVVETYDREARERVGLMRELADLRQLNTRLGAEAQELTRALKGDTRAQGAWGEMLLQRLLEAAGLESGVAYTLQMSASGADGDRQRPDALIHLPDRRDLVIDSKVSLLAYERYCNASDAATRAQALKAHVTSLREHIRSLAERRYTDLVGVRTLDYVLMFVPIEAAFVEAVRADDELYRYAMERNVALVTPATLLTTLRTVASLWANEKRHRNVEEIARRAGLLYDKFVGFIEDLKGLRKQLDQAQRAWDEAWHKLAHGRGNLVGQAEELKRLGARAQKALPADLVEEALPGPKAAVAIAEADPGATDHARLVMDGEETSAAGAQPAPADASMP